MTASDFTLTLVTDKTPKEAFNAINNVRGWWTEELEGSSQNLNDEFTVRFFDDIHVSTQRLVEVVPDKKVVWLVTKSKLTFLKNQTEWTGTKVSFEIAKKNGKTEIRFIHHGLVPEIECYKDCTGGWNQYIGSLDKLLTTGKGKPELKPA
jgi:Activator of Hsp90 ATPase homolog 1-like protein